MILKKLRRVSIHGVKKENYLLMKPFQVLSGNDAIQNQLNFRNNFYSKMYILRWKILEHFLQTSSIQNDIRIGAFLLFQGFFFFKF